MSLGRGFRTDPAGYPGGEIRAVVLYLLVTLAVREEPPCYTFWLPWLFGK